MALLRNLLGTTPVSVDTGPNVADVFSTYLYEGTGTAQSIDNGINFLGTPAEEIDDTILSSFSTDLYTGTGTTQSINNGIDLAGDGGLTWRKSRTQPSGSGYYHNIIDTERGVSQVLWTNETAAQTNAYPALTSFNSDGFTMDFGDGAANQSGDTYASWTFKKTPKFFDIVTYTGDGTAGIRSISHSLGVDPGMIVIKRTSAVGDWAVYHRSLGTTKELRLNTTAGFSTNGYVPSVSSTDFSVSASSAVNSSGSTYIAYVFAHDPDGMVACGSFNSTGFVDLGWEPQYVLMKSTTDTGDYTGDWRIFDNERGVQVGDDAQLFANDGREENTNAFGTALVFNPTGFTVESQGHYGTSTVYMAIRKPQMAGAGGMVWIKNRDRSYSHYLFDTERDSLTNALRSDTTNGEVGAGSMITSANSDGFTLDSNWSTNIPAAQGLASYVSWSFRKAPRFFDVVTYSGQATDLTVQHSLGVIPGMIIVKDLTVAGDWKVHHISLGEYKEVVLNKTDASGSTGGWNGYVPTDVDFQVNGGQSGWCQAGHEYVAYLFAHDPDGENDDGMIACGSFSHNYSGAEVNLGWEPQYILLKPSSTSGDWRVFDTMRGIVTGGLSGDGDASLSANTSGAENVNTWGVDVTSTGFTVFGNNILSSGTAIYMAIRAPMMVEPEAGTEVFKANYGLNASADGKVWEAGFPVDMYFRNDRTGGSIYLSDRIRGSINYLVPHGTQAESAVPYSDRLDNQTGVYSTNAYNYTSWCGWMFKRTKGFMDVVAYTGNGTSGHTVNHSLGVVPEMMMIKRRTGSATAWLNIVNITSSGFHNVRFDSDTGGWARTYSGNMLTAQPTDGNFQVGTNSNCNESTYTYIAYLFATLAGVSKVGSYTGNGGTNFAIDCGFSGGARFVLIKRTDSTGDWFMWDTARGIIASNDPHVSLNSTSAEVTSDDSIDPNSAGFEVNQRPTTNINVYQAIYIFLAIA